MYAIFSIFPPRSEFGAVFIEPEGYGEDDIQRIYSERGTFSEGSPPGGGEGGRVVRSLRLF
jgi:hypothetical protein